jgi:hypothetical protein
MPLTVVHQQSLISLSSIMKDTQSIFMIPTFQRPFAWEEKQLQDLYEDIENTMRILKSAPNNNIHYLAPIHLIPFNASDRNNPTLKAYLTDNEDVHNLLHSLSESGNDFINNEGEGLKVYFVIDGQQRLTTLYFIYQFVYTSSGSKSNPLQVTLQNGRDIPRLIQNPLADHDYFVKLLKNLNSLNTLPPSNTQAQKRMYKAIDRIATWTDWNTTPTDFTKFLRSDALRSLLIELEPHYGLTSFQTLNDRGKSLTALEKFKSLLFENDLNHNVGKLAHRIHDTFSNLYQVLDEGSYSGLFPEGEKGDDLLMQYIFTYVGISKNADNYWQSGNNAYAKLRDELISAPNKGILLSEWLNAIQEIHEQIKHLNDCLLGKEPTVKNPSFICSGRTIQDDYKIIIRSLGLSSRSIAVMLKFRVLYKTEWHDRFPMQCKCDPNLFKSLSVQLNEIRGGTQNNEILKQIDALNMPSCNEESLSYPCQYSMLQAIERMELLIWNKYDPKGTFRDKWNAVFSNANYTADKAVIAWYSWYYAENDFPRFIQNDTHDRTFRYVLREYEEFLNHGTNVHFDPDLTLEHIFPQNPNPNPPANYGFGTANDYDRFINRIGNLTFVYQNSRLSNQLPDTKASLYLQPQTPNQPEITRRVGTQLLPLTINYPAYQDALRVRCTEIAIFSLKRFFC